MPYLGCLHSFACPAVCPRNRLCLLRPRTGLPFPHPFTLFVPLLFFFLFFLFFSSGLGDSFYEYLLKAWLQAKGDYSYTYLLEVCVPT